MSEQAFNLEQELGDVVDQLNTALVLSALGPVAYDGVIAIIRSARRTAKSVYMELIGNDPWEEFDALPARNEN